MKWTLDIFSNYISDPINLIISKIKLLKLLDFILMKKDSYFINFFLKDILYKKLRKYLIYENLYDEDRFMLFFNKLTEDYDRSIDFYYFVIVLFKKWNDKLGKIKN